MVCASFLFDRTLDLSFRDRLRIVKRLYAASFTIDSPHRQEEMLRFIRAILRLPRSGGGVIVEAEAYKGSSTAKFSLAAALAGRELVGSSILFQGMPANATKRTIRIFSAGRKGSGRAHIAERWKR